MKKYILIEIIPFVVLFAYFGWVHFAISEIKNLDNKKVFGEDVSISYGNLNYSYLSFPLKVRTDTINYKFKFNGKNTEIRLKDPEISVMPFFKPTIKSCSAKLDFLGRNSRSRFKFRS